MKSKIVETDRMKIAKRLKEARLMSGLSQGQSAKIVNIQRPAISEIEAGRRKVSAEEIIQFSRIYKVDSSWLLCENEHESVSQSNNYKFAARELEKLDPEEIEKLVHFLKIFPKK